MPDLKEFNGIWIQESQEGRDEFLKHFGIGVGVGKRPNFLEIFICLLKFSKFFSFFFQIVANSFARS